MLIVTVLLDVLTEQFIAALNLWPLLFWDVHSSAFDCKEDLTTLFSAAIVVNCQVREFLQPTDLWSQSWDEGDEMVDI